MPGRRSFAPAAFVPVKLGQFPLSDRVLKAALPDEKMLVTFFSNSLFLYSPIIFFFSSLCALTEILLL